jgi:hypothetical protein
MVVSSTIEPEFMVIRLCSATKPAAPDLEVWSWEIGLPEEDLDQKLTTWATTQVDDFVREMLSAVKS